MPVFSFLRRSRTSESVSFAHHVRRYLALTGWSVLCMSAGLLVYLTGLHVDRFVRHSDFFQLRHIHVVGATEALNGRIQDVVATLREKGEDNLVTFNLERAEFQVQNLPRVRAVRFLKTYPDTLTVEVSERRPVTVANLGELYWIDREGVLLGRAEPSALAEHATPILTGVRGSKFYAGQQIDQPRLREILQAVEYLQEHSPELASRFAEWNINAQDEITGILRGGVEVRFGESHPLDRLARLDALMTRKGDLAQFTYVDLRFDSQIVYL